MHVLLDFCRGFGWGSGKSLVLSAALHHFLAVIDSLSLASLRSPLSVPLTSSFVWRKRQSQSSERFRHRATVVLSAAYLFLLAL